ADYYQIDLTSQIQSGDNFDITNLGSYVFWFTVEDAAGNKDSVVRIVNVVDDVDPMITLIGANPLVVEVNTDINDPGYTATDNFFGNVFVQVDSSMVDKGKVGHRSEER